MEVRLLQGENGEGASRHRQKDLREILEEDEKAELECHFCGSKYGFSKEELERMVKEL